MKLSNREKMMLLVLSLVIVGWGGIQYLVLPSYTSYQQLKLDKQQMIQKQLEVQQKLARQNTIEKEIEDVKEVIEVNLKEFYEHQNVEYFYDWLVDMGDEYGVIVSSLALEAPQVKIAASYASELKELDYALKTHKQQIEHFIKVDEVDDALTTDKESNNESEIAEETKDQLVHYGVGIEVTGEQKKMMDMINAISEDSRYAIVEQFSLVNEVKENTNPEEKAEDLEGQMIISFYAVDKIQLEPESEVVQTVEEGE